MSDKHQRMEHANELIKIIGSHGRKFFWNEENQRFAKFEIRNNGRVYFIDDYKLTPIYISKRCEFRGFSHGGTLQALVVDMKDYIVHGCPISRWKIVIQQLGHYDLVGNIWGYDVISAQAVRDAAYSLPICAEAGK